MVTETGMSFRCRCHRGLCPVSGQYSTSVWRGWLYLSGHHLDIVDRSRAVGTDPRPFTHVPCVLRPWSVRYWRKGGGRSLGVCIYASCIIE